MILGSCTKAVYFRRYCKKYGVARCHISDVVNGKRWGANNYIQKGE